MRKAKNETCLGSENKNSSRVITTIVDKFKHILGLKKPVVVLQNILGAKKCTFKNVNKKRQSKKCSTKVHNVSKRNCKNRNKYREIKQKLKRISEAKVLICELKNLLHVKTMSNDKRPTNFMLERIWTDTCHPVTDKDRSINKRRLRNLKCIRNDLPQQATSDKETDDLTDFSVTDVIVSRRETQIRNVQSTLAGTKSSEDESSHSDDSSVTEIVSDMSDSMILGNRLNINTNKICTRAQKRLELNRKNCKTNDNVDKSASKSSKTFPKYDEIRKNYPHLKDLKVSLCKIRLNIKNSLDVCTTCLKAKSCAPLVGRTIDFENRKNQKIDEVDHNDQTYTCNVSTNNKIIGHGKHSDADEELFKKNKKRALKRLSFSDDSLEMCGSQKRKKIETPICVQNKSNEAPENFSDSAYSDAKRKVTGEIQTDQRTNLQYDQTEKISNPSTCFAEIASAARWTISGTTEGSIHKAFARKTIEDDYEIRISTSSLPTIIGDNILPKDTVKLLKAKEGAEGQIKGLNETQSARSGNYDCGSTNSSSSDSSNFHSSSSSSSSSSSDSSVSEYSTGRAKHLKDGQLTDGNADSMLRTQSVSLPKFGECKENVSTAVNGVQDAEHHKENENPFSNYFDRPGPGKMTKQSLIASKLRLYYESMAGCIDGNNVAFPDVPSNDLLVEAAHVNSTLPNLIQSDASSIKPSENVSRVSEMSNLTVDDQQMFAHSLNTVSDGTKGNAKSVRRMNISSNKDALNTQLKGDEVFDDKNNNDKGCIERNRKLSGSAEVVRSSDVCEDMSTDCTDKRTVKIDRTGWINRTKLESDNSTIINSSHSEGQLPNKNTAAMDIVCFSQPVVNSDTNNTAMHQYRIPKKVLGNNAGNATAKAGKSNTEKTGALKVCDRNEDKGSFCNENLDDTDDCISLFAEPELMNEYEDTFLPPPKTAASSSSKPLPSGKSSVVHHKDANVKSTKNASKPPSRSVTKSVHSDDTYIMNDKVLDNFINTNKSEFVKDYNSAVAADAKSKTRAKRKRARDVRNRIGKNGVNPVPPLLPPNSNAELKKPDTPNNASRGVRLAVLRAKFEATSRVDKLPGHRLEDIFRGYCYTTMRSGICPSPCRYNHDFDILIVRLFCTQRQYLLCILEYVTSRRCRFFSQKMFLILLTYVESVVIIQMFAKLYRAQMLDQGIIDRTIVELLKHNVCLKSLVSEFMSFILDWENGESILMAMERHIKPGDYWNTFKDLILSLEYPSRHIIEKILQECVTTRTEYIQDVNESLIKKLDDVSQINPELLKSFKDLLTPPIDHGIAGSMPSLPSLPALPSLPSCTDRNRNVEQIRSPTPVRMESVPSTSNLPEIFNLNSPSGGNVELSTHVNSQCDSSFVVHRIDDLRAPYSAHGRDKFWKFYVDLYALQEGLKHEDYEYVINILEKIPNSHPDDPDPSHFFSSACSNILCKEIKKSEYHMNKMISLTVQTGGSIALRELLFDVGVRILLNLTDEGSWVLAYKLLGHLGVHFYQYNAALTILIAEIYLANRRPVKAFDLLKKSKIIHTNRDKWGLPNNLEDENLRAGVLGVLLNSISEASPERAVFLLEFLIADQANNFYPIDLPRSAERIVPILLLRNETELFIRIGKLMKQYDFTLSVKTSRALIAKLVDIDMDLATHLFQRASFLGIYSQVKNYPAIHVIMNPDWTDGEIYLMLLELFKQISSAIGHAIDSIGPNQLVVYLVFEIVPTEKQLSFKGENESSERKIKESCKLVRHILSTRFLPPIRLVKKFKGRIRKLMAKSLLNYLKGTYRD